MSSAASRISLAVPRHLQDYNGYCGPACAMMVLEAEAQMVPAQSELFRSIRAHAKAVSDRRPIKSPAESLLDLLDKQSGRRWKKLFDPEPLPVAEALLRTIQDFRQPALILISKGMHWVVVFGRTLKEDGNVAGVLLRDPAWAGMPPFFGLSIYPDKTTFTHTNTPCACLNSDNSPGTVHERYVAFDELLSPRGLQGSPDWEGKGALALVPAEAPAADIKLGSSVSGVGGAAAAIAAWASPAEAALPQALEHGLYGRPDSPAVWQAALDGGQPGEPILVKAPDDPRDDFYLVPIISQGQKGGTAANRTAWIILDAQTLKLREASLLDNWKAPAFPNHQDTLKLSESEVTLPDGTRTQYRAPELKPNQKNLVWKASAATILPYWPVKEWLAPHPETGEPVSIYQTQEGKIYTALTPDEPLPAVSKGSAPELTSIQPPKPGKPWLATCAGIIIGAAGGFLWPRPAPPQTTTQLQQRIKQLETKVETDAGTISTLKAQLAKPADGPSPDKQVPVLLMKIETLKNQVTELTKAINEGQEPGRRKDKDLGPGATLGTGPRTDPKPTPNTEKKTDQ